jgi:hypothetical protein
MTHEQLLNLVFLFCVYVLHMYMILELQTLVQYVERQNVEIQIVDFKM